MARKTNDGCFRANVSLPGRLRPFMARLKHKINWSAVATKAIETAITQALQDEGKPMLTNDQKLDILEEIAGMVENQTKAMMETIDGLDELKDLTELDDFLIAVSKHIRNMDTTK